METKSILIKDTTKEERRRIVEEAINAWSDSSCEMDDSPIDYQQYIDGIKELRELNAEYKANYVQASCVNQDMPRQSCTL